MNMVSHRIRSAFWALFFMLALPAFAQSVVKFDKEPLVIETTAGQKYNFTVEIADTNEQRQRGLMYRQDMAADAGMIFDFGASKRVQMWMENTVLPLDMLFVDRAGIVRGVKQNAVPYSRDIIDSVSPVKYVIELNAGAAAKLGLKAGDRVTSPTITKYK
ncbi:MULTISPECIES: DUF192 domain-containing protein [unclassified Rhizobium]|jgi:uncharacterized membrane protein (UPF0127 family)|uniref:DUF192 domain-containing protein n=1 Tax=unclassified Rhizobium TaxID=2613769 RepID=UPI000DDBEF76|nr:DUF192 domain-containing protein [Rhizobium sp. UBA1881]